MKGDGGRGGHEAINVQMASVGTVRMRVTLGQRGRKDYALLNAERMVYISFAISVFKHFFFVCVFFHIYLLFFKIFGVFSFGVGSSNVECLGL